MVTTTFNVRSYALRLAHTIKKTCVNFSNALKQAWKVAKLKSLHFAKFQFVKIETGEIRNANGVILDIFTTKKNNVCVKFFDDDKQEIRTFRVETLI